MGCDLCRYLRGTLDVPDHRRDRRRPGHVDGRRCSTPAPTTTSSSRTTRRAACTGPRRPPPPGDHGGGARRHRAALRRHHDRRRRPPGRPRGPRWWTLPRQFELLVDAVPQPGPGAHLRHAHQGGLGLRPSRRRRQGVAHRRQPSAPHARQRARSGRPSRPSTMSATGSRCPTRSACGEPRRRCPREVHVHRVGGGQEKCRPFRPTRRRESPYALHFIVGSSVHSVVWAGTEIVDRGRRARCSCSAAGSSMSLRSIVSRPSPRPSPPSVGSGW